MSTTHATHQVLAEFGEEGLGLIVGHGWVDDDILTLLPVDRSGDSVLITDLESYGEVKRQRSRIAFSHSLTIDNPIIYRRSSLEWEAKYRNNLGLTEWFHQSYDQLKQGRRGSDGWSFWDQWRRRCESRIQKDKTASFARSRVITHSERKALSITVSGILFVQHIIQDRDLPVRIGDLEWIRKKKSKV